MTVIAYDKRYIAVDSRITQSHHIADDDYNKIIELGEWVIFWSGSLGQKDSFIHAFVFNAKFTDPVKSGLIAFSKITKKVFYVNCEDELMVKAELTYADAIGSGCDHAITAMDLGLSAVEAVRMAIKRDSCCGGTIRCFDTKTGKFTKAKHR